MKERLVFISFEKSGNKYETFFPMEELISNEKDIERLAKRAAKIYENAIHRMLLIISKMNNQRVERKPVSARMVWQLGDSIFKLTRDLEKISFQLDGLYEHLARDLTVKRKWLEKVIILRRYIPEISLIPAYLNWGQCEKGTRKVAEKISRGLPLNE
jgi:hypothetical protein